MTSETKALQFFGGGRAASFDATQRTLDEGDELPVSCLAIIWTKRNHRYRFCYDCRNKHG